MTLNYSDVVAIAKSVTELSIQNKIFSVYDDQEKTAEEIAKFYNAFIKAITDPDTD